MLFCEVILLCRWSRFVLWDDNVRSCLTILFSLCNVISMTPMQVCLDFRQQNMNSILFSIMLYRPRSFCRRGTWPLACRSGLTPWRLQSADWRDIWVFFLLPPIPSHGIAVTSGEEMPLIFCLFVWIQVLSVHSAEPRTERGNCAPPKAK